LSPDYSRIDQVTQAENHPARHRERSNNLRHELRFLLLPGQSDAPRSDLRQGSPDQWHLDRVKGELYIAAWLVLEIDVVPANLDALTSRLELEISAQVIEKLQKFSRASGRSIDELALELIDRALQQDSGAAARHPE
jgi:hypothetical protein